MKVVPIFALLILFTTTIFAAETHKEFQVQPGKRLNLELRTGGKVRIEGWNKEAVSVDAFISGPDRENCDLKIEQTPSGVEVRSRYLGDDDESFDIEASYDIRVPSRFDVDIDSMGGGVTIQNVEGNFSGSTMGGALNLSGLKGTIDLSTMGGRIDLTKSHLDGEVSTMGGAVLMEEVTGNVQGSTMGGKVTRKGSGTTGTTGEIDISSMGGELNVDDAPSGAKLSTMGGDIHVRAAKKHVSAKTMGGDIQIDSIDGWVRAETMGGNIAVVMTGDPATGQREVELTSYGGDIEITLPSELAMTLDLELAYTKGKSGRYSIQSDFPVKTEESEEWERHHGSDRKYINGYAKVGAGTHRVRIRTINGDIIVKKS